MKTVQHIVAAGLPYRCKRLLIKALYLCSSFATSACQLHVQHCWHNIAALASHNVMFFDAYDVMLTVVRSHAIPCCEPCK